MRHSFICDCPGAFPRQRRPPRPAGGHSSCVQIPCGHAAANRPLPVTVPSCSESSARPCPGLRGAESGPGQHAPPQRLQPTGGDPAEGRAPLPTGTRPATSRSSMVPAHPGPPGAQAGGGVSVGKDGTAGPATGLRGPLHTPGPAAEPPEDDHEAWGRHSASGNPRTLKTLQGCLCRANGRPWRGRGGAEVP